MKLWKINNFYSGGCGIALSHIDTDLERQKCNLRYHILLSNSNEVYIILIIDDPSTKNDKPILDWINSPHYIFEESGINFMYVRLCDLDISREKWLNYEYLQTVETLIKHGRIVRRLIWDYTVCQFPFWRSPD